MAYSKSSLSAGSAAKPVTAGVLVFYDIAWQAARFNNPLRTEETLHADLYHALEIKTADVVMLCGCGEIGVGLGDRWSSWTAAAAPAFPCGTRATTPASFGTRP